MKKPLNHNQYLLQSAFDFFNNGDIVSADKILDNYDISYSSDFDADFYNLKSIIYFRNKEFNNSLKFIELAINLTPNCVNFYINKANVLRELGQLVESLKNYDIALKYDPNNSRIYFNKALLFIDLNNFKYSEMSVHWDSTSNLMNQVIE